MNEELNEANKQKIKFLFENNIPTHITLQSRKHRNGKIISINNDGIEINDFIKGTIFLVWAEIFSAEEYKERVNENDK